jgi:hypothetical protein
MNNIEKKQFQQIINYLIETTKDGSREWERASHTFNSEICYYMQSFSEDKKTRFETVIKFEYDDNNKLVYTKHGCMIIHNRGFSGSGYQVFGLNDSRDILILEKLVNDNFVVNLLPTVAPNTVFDDILSGMGVQYTRDKKLEQLLEGVEPETEKKKGFLSKLF